MPEIDIIVEPIGYPEAFDIIHWLVEDNAAVERGQSVIEIDTEKVSAEIPVQYPGVVHILRREGKQLPFYSVVGKLEVTDEVYAEHLRRESRVNVILPLTPEQYEKLHKLRGDLSVEQYVTDLVLKNLEENNAL